MHARGLDHLVWAVRDLDAAADCLQRLGFTVTPRARHPWGTENRCVQLDGFFIELLTVGEAAQIPPAANATFSFGAFNRDFLETGEGASMLVAESQDPAADRRAFEQAGLPVFAPFAFEREQTLADGGVRKVGFDLTFTRDRDDARNGFFTCRNRYPENFWSADYQRHDNGAQSLEAVIVVCDEPASHHIFYSAFTGVRDMRASSLGITIDTPRGAVRLFTPGAFAGLFAQAAPRDPAGAPVIAALVIRGADRAALIARLEKAGMEYVLAPEGLLVPETTDHGLSLVFA